MKTKKMRNAFFYLHKIRVNSTIPRCKNVNVRFTTIPSKALSDQV